jgi:hypothetical protein
MSGPRAAALQATPPTDSSQPPTASHYPPPVTCRDYEGEQSLTSLGPLRVLIGSHICHRYIGGSDVRRCASREEHQVDHQAVGPPPKETPGGGPTPLESLPHSYLRDSRLPTTVCYLRSTRHLDPHVTGPSQGRTRRGWPAECEITTLGVFGFVGWGGWGLVR